LRSFGCLLARYLCFDEMTRMRIAFDAVIVDKPDTISDLFAESMP
jgi:hypothetical protein